MFLGTSLIITRTWYHVIISFEAKMHLFYTKVWDHKAKQILSNSLHPPALTRRLFFLQGARIVGKTSTGMLSGPSPVKWSNGLFNFCHHYCNTELWCHQVYFISGTYWRVISFIDTGNATVKTKPRESKINMKFIKITSSHELCSGMDFRVRQGTIYFTQCIAGLVLDPE